MIFTSGGAGLFGIDLDLKTARNQFDCGLLVLRKVQTLIMRLQGYPFV